MSHLGCVTLAHNIFILSLLEIIIFKTFSNYLYTPLTPESVIFHQAKHLGFFLHFSKQHILSKIRFL